MTNEYFAAMQERSDTGGLWRPGYHFTPPKAWMNDPNGLIYYKGWYHLFYQYNPKHCNWDSMHWGHAVSTDMIHWKDMPIALTPDQSYDNHPEGGCFSGSAVEKDGILYLFYSATVKEGGRVYQSQCMASSKDGIHFEKYEGNPVIPGPPPGTSQDFRDPKVFKEKEQWYMVVGGSVGGAEQKGDGRIFLYQSKDLFHWTYKGTVLESKGRLGTMFECPDMFYLQGKWIVTCSPMNHPGYNKALYCVGTMDFETCRYTVEKIGNMDVGFDYYAPQSFVDAHGNRVLIAWQNGWLWMPWCRDWGPTSVENWRGACSIPRRACLDEDWNLCLYPVEELENLVEKSVLYHNLEAGTQKKYLPVGENRRYRLLISLDEKKISSRYVEICVLGKGERFTRISLDLVGKVITLDKDASDLYEGGRMNCPVKPKGEKWELCILVDKSSVEIYVNGGRYCITSNVYPQWEQTQCWVQTPYKDAVLDFVQVDCMKSFWEEA